MTPPTKLLSIVLFCTFWCPPIKLVFFKARHLCSIKKIPNQIDVWKLPRHYLPAIAAIYLLTLLGAYIQVWIWEIDLYTINYIFPIIVSFINSSDQQLMRKITGVAIHFRKNPQWRPPSIFWQPIIIIQMQWEAAALILFICGSIVYYIQQYRNMTNPYI